MNKRYLPILNKRYPQSLQNCLNDFKKSWDDLDKLTKLNEKWDELIGPELSLECRPLKIEKKVLTIVVNQPQWRQALIYNKHKLKETIYEFGINLDEIRIIQNYEEKTSDKKGINAKIIWENHPSRITKNNMTICKFCKSPTPNGEISRWGKCTFCWRKNN